MSDELTQAPDLPHHFYWFNTQQPLSLLDDLTGYVVLLYFWRGTSINCQHVQPTMHYLEQRFAERSFLIIGVHAASFEAEQDPDHVQEAIRRFGVRHPVVIDEDNELWDAYGCVAWPYFALIDSGGCLRFQGAGEPERDRMAGAIEFLLDDAAAAGEEPYMELALDEYEPQIRLAGLAFPSGIAVDEDKGRLWIADTRHHRVVAIGLQDSKLQAVVGTGWPGAADGSLEVATFFEPTALTVVDSDVFVADTGNHLLRRIDFEAQRVETVLGTGRPVIDTMAGGTGTDQPLNSPLGLATDGESLYVAMSGSHQIWRVDLATKSAEVLAGSGETGQCDGLARDASLSQPGGLAISGTQLAFVDSGASSLRCVNLASQEVHTLVDGDMQFPSALAWHGDDLLIADTFHDKIRRWRKEGVLDTLAVEVHRPTALCVVGDSLFIADAGSHRVLRLGLADCVVAEVSIADLPAGRSAFNTDYEHAHEVTLPPMAEVTLRIPMDLGEATVLQPGTSPSLFTANVEGYPLLIDGTLTPDTEDGWFMVRGLATGTEGEGMMRLRLNYVTCEEPGQVCHMHERRIDLPVKLEADTENCADVLVVPGAS
ncbi:MAG: thioredoxin-like domain-containing protein [Planctomycetota bacterium]|nr:thioredoxin-like domain-containing protein [Planctomycetota bacterium]